MIYTRHNTIDVGRRLKSVFDANGLDYSDHLFVQIDTETGWVEYFQKMEFGLTRFDELTGEPMMTKERLAAPVLVMFEDYNLLGRSR